MTEDCKWPRFGAILADPAWRFADRGHRSSPERPNMYRYSTMSTEDIAGLPILQHAGPHCSLYLWCCNAILQDGLNVMAAWGFAHKGLLVWVKTRGDGGVFGGGLGHYFRNATEIVLFGTRGRPQMKVWRHNIILAPPRGHSTKPDELYDLIEECSNGPYLELFARQYRPNWTQWGDEAGKRPGQLIMTLKP